MNLKNKPLAGSDVWSAPGCLILACLASAISIAISTIAGWQRGGSDEEKVLLASFGVLAVLSAHLLLALCRPASLFMRVVGFALWSTCMVFVAYSHASYFLRVQDQVGERRVAAADQSQWTPLVTPKRSLSAILAEQVKIKAMQAGNALVACANDCTAHSAREAVLKARLLALDAEAGEVGRWQLAQDRLETQRSAMRGDPVTTRLAAWLGTTDGLVSLVTGLLFSVILEGLGCLCWYLALSRRDPLSGHAVTRELSDMHEIEVAENVHEIQPLSELQELASLIKPEIEAGRVKCTVKAIRVHLGCSQGKASEVRRMLGASGLALTQA